jgi:hypothetical protein
VHGEQDEQDEQKEPYHAEKELVPHFHSSKSSQKQPFNSGGSTAA